MQKNINFLGIPIIKVRKTEKAEKRYFLGIQYKLKKYADRYFSFSEAFSKNITTIRNRHIKVITNNLGEAVVYARTVKFWHNKNDLIFATQPAQIDIFQMYAPGIPVFYCPYSALKAPEQDENGNRFSAVLFDKDLIEMNNSGKPFFKSFSDYLNADFSTASFKPAMIPEGIKTRVLAKAKALKVNIDNFVFLSPKSTSLDNLSQKFWNDLEIKLKEKGFDVFYNSKLFSIAETYVLANKAKAIISLRSGLNDVLCELKVPQHIIYTYNFSYNDLQPMYSFDTFPWSAKEYITEYNCLTENLNSIQNKILERLS